MLAITLEGGGIWYIPWISVWDQHTILLLINILDEIMNGSFFFVFFFFFSWGTKMFHMVWKCSGSTESKKSVHSKDFTGWLTVVYINNMASISQHTKNEKNQWKCDTEKRATLVNGGVLVERFIELNSPLLSLFMYNEIVGAPHQLKRYKNIIIW